MSRTVRSVLTAVVVLLLALGPALGITPWAPAPTARAFDPRVHVAMFQETLGSMFSADAQEAVIDGLEYADSASVGGLADPLLGMFTRIGPGQEHSEWHFDNAKNPEELCKLWNDFEAGKKLGPDKMLFDTAAYAVEAFKKDSADPAGLDRVGGFRRVALFHYGVYLHAIQDFYSHTNWIELHAAANTQAGLAPIQSGCDPITLAALQPRLQSGYFNMNADNIDFCDYQYIFGTYHLPAGFDYCHGPAEFSWKVRFLSALQPSQRLAKDSAHLFHGGEVLTLPGGTQTTYHQEARRLATLATVETSTVLHDRVVAKFKEQLPDRDPECLFQALITGSDPACPRRAGLVDRYQGEIAVVDDASLALWEYPSGGVIKSDVSTALRNVRTEIQFDVVNIPYEGAFIVTGGSLTFQVDNKATGDHIVYEATQAEGMIGSVADGYDGWIDFTGTLTRSSPNLEPIVFPDHVESFALAVDAAGQPVLCQRLPLPTLDGVRQYQDCVARAVVRLLPAQPPA